MTTKRALRSLLLSTVLASAPALVMAQSTEVTDLDAIIVSGGLTGISKTAFTRAFSEITAAEIEARGLTTVQDALRALPGVAVVSTGGTLTEVRMRGGEGNYTKVLVDGVEVNNATDGYYVFAGLSAADIERIEVLPGAQSVFYGTSAMSGVISITTKKADKSGISYGGGLEAGANGSYDANIYLRQRFERGQLSFALDRKRETNKDGAYQGGDHLADNSTTVSLNGDYALTETVTTGFSFRKTWQDYGYYDTNTPVSDPRDYLVNNGNSTTRVEDSGSLWLEAEAMGGRLLNRVELAGSEKDWSYHTPGSADYDMGANRYTLKYTGSFALDGSDARAASQKLNLLLSGERETFYTAASWGGGEDARSSRSIALEYQGEYASGIDVQAGVRHDWIDVFEDPTSWNLAAAWRAPGSALRLRGSVGKATVFPTMYEQFGYSPGLYAGNPNLKPETAHSYELGADLDLAQGRGKLGLTLFQADVKNLISFNAASATNLAGTSTRKGFELSGEWQASDWLKLSASYTYTDARGPSGQHLIRRPSHELAVHANADAFGGRGSVAADVRYVAGSYDEEQYNIVWPAVPATTKLPSFATLDLATNYALTDTLSLTGRVINVFDTDYSEAWGFYGQGRTLYVGLKSAW